MEEADRLAEALAALIARNQPDAQDVAIHSLSKIIGGASSDIWSFDAAWCERTTRRGGAFILRRAAEREFESSGRAAEFRLLRALADKPIPAPRALWLDEAGAFLGRPAMVLEHMRGRAERALLVSGRRPEERRALAQEATDMLAAIHAIDPRSLDLDPAMRAGSHPAAEQLALYEAAIARDETEPLPELRLASLWLHDHSPPPPPRRVLVHGDYRPANLLIDEGAITGVLDWEFAHEGDPAEDLGWMLSPYYAQEHFAEPLWTAEDFIARYEAANGARVDRAAAHFWSVFAMYKLASMMVSALAAATAGDASRLAGSVRFIVDPLLRSLLEPPSWAQ